ncbi:hypothetical protein LSH36_376g00005 [Paralvinella palmiformis]|uniref:Rhodanese domain-containing protein n=1 Tax=Paralvinella palmiformis TaxID=53620 RepID=A0AAD9JDD6_9ANNE|nr:hypothetical protein LSH36_376g00005 [Paralvinella palmiformis]
MGVVTAEWLKQKLDAKQSDIVVLDVTWYSNKDAAQDFLQKHIPGAQYFNIMHDVEISDLFPRNLPDPESFQRQVRSIGVNSNSHVVVYDNTPFCGYFVGARAWWMFKLHGHDRLSILDGALKSWEDHGYPVTSDTYKSELGNFSVQMNLSLLRRHDDMVENLKSKHYQVCDTRPESDYKGQSTAATLCGATDVAVYLGGFTEWSTKAGDGLIEQGPA